MDRPRLAVLTLFATSCASGCEVKNPDHCDNRGGDAACPAATPVCDPLVAANDGCVAEADSASTAAATSTSTSSNGGTSTSTGGQTGTAGSTGAPAVCGDGMVGGDEKCDGTDLGGLDCEKVGLGAGTLMCAPDCSMFDVQQCEKEPECGNGVREGNEPCDGEDLGGATCGMLPTFVSGDLSCTAMCTLDTSACVPCAEDGDECMSDADCCSGHCEGIAGILLKECV